MPRSKLSTSQGGESRPLLLSRVMCLFSTHSSSASCPHTSEHNEVAERKHCKIFETAQAHALSASIPREFWAEVVLTFVYLIHRLSSSVLSSISPNPLSSRTPPNHSCLKVFGSTFSILLEMSAPRKWLFSFESWLSEAENHTHGLSLL